MKKKQKFKTVYFDSNDKRNEYIQKLIESTTVTAFGGTGKDGDKLFITYQM